MSFEFREARREQTSLIIGLVGPSGGGKTMSALRLATGLAGTRPFVVIDTEAGRAKHYADQFRFHHGDLTAPFSPAHYAEAIQAADAAGYPVIVVDSFSHEHAGTGGLLDMQEEEFKQMGYREAARMASWIKPKMAHKKLVQALLQIRAHLILCFRAEEKVDMVKGADGKMTVVPKTTLSGFSKWIPISEKSLLYELTASILLTPDQPGIPQPIKLEAQMRPFFPLTQPITEASGERLAAWAAGGAVGAPKGSTPKAAEGKDGGDVEAQQLRAPSAGTAYSAGTAGTPADPTPSTTQTMAEELAGILRGRIKMLIKNRRLTDTDTGRLFVAHGLNMTTWEQADVAALTDLFNALNKLPREEAP